MGDLLGRLPGGASGDDPRSEGSPRQDLLAALAFLDPVDGKVAAAERERFEQLRDQVRSADGGQGLPEALLHGNLLHARINWIAGFSSANSYAPETEMRRARPGLSPHRASRAGVALA